MPITFDAGSAVGAAIGGAFDTAGAALQTSANKAAQLRQFRFAERMYKNRYQFTMEDMESAGLNPILAYQQGAGSTPTGVAMAGAPNIMQGAAASARGLASVSAQVKEARERTGLVKIQKDESFNRSLELFRRSHLNMELEQKAKADTEVSKATARNVRLNTSLGATGLPAARAQQELDETEGGKALRWLNRVIRSVTGRDSTGAKR